MYLQFSKPWLKYLLLEITVSKTFSEKNIYFFNGLGKKEIGKDVNM